MLSKESSVRILVIVTVVIFSLFFFLLTTYPYYFSLGVEHYIPKSSPAWGYVMPNSPEALFFFILAFVFLALWTATVMLLIWKRPDIAQRGIHPNMLEWSSLQKHRRMFNKT